MSSWSNLSRRIATQANLSNSAGSSRCLLVALTVSDATCVTIRGFPGVRGDRYRWRALGPRDLHPDRRSSASSTISARPSIRSCTSATSSLTVRATSGYPRISAAFSDSACVAIMIRPRPTSRRRRMTARTLGAPLASTVPRSPSVNGVRRVVASSSARQVRSRSSCRSGVTSAPFELASDDGALE